MMAAFVSVDPRRDTPEHLARYVEFFDPTAERWVAISRLEIARRLPSHTVLLDGTVLVAGGRPASAGDTLRSAEIYDPCTS